MTIRPKYLRGLLCFVVAFMILASVFIIAMAKEDTPAYMEGSALIEESETQGPSPSPTPTPIPSDTPEESGQPSMTSAPATEPDEGANKPDFSPSVGGTVSKQEPSPIPSASPITSESPEESEPTDILTTPTIEPDKETDQQESFPSPAATPIPSEKPGKNAQPDVTPAPTPDSDEEADEIEDQLPPEETADKPIPEYPPAWAESGQAYLKGNLMVAEQIKLLQGALLEQVNNVREAFTMPENVAVTYDPDNLIDVFAIYAMRHGMIDDFPYKVMIESQMERDELWSIFWDLTRVNGTVKYVGGQKGCSIHVSRSSFADHQVWYDFNLNQREAIRGLITPENADILKSQFDNSILSSLTDEEYTDVQAQLRDVTGERRAVLLAALSLKGKVGYFWGGKSYHVGWDERWGEMRTVTSGNSKTTSTARSLGMDCSGFVSWAFINAGGSKEVLKFIGNGSANQWRNSKMVGWNDVQPGDLVFYRNPASSGINHVGIVVGSDTNDKLRVVHCSSSRNSVVVTGAAGFKYARRPYIYSN